MLDGSGVSWLVEVYQGLSPAAGSSTSPWPSPSPRRQLSCAEFQQGNFCNENGSLHLFPHESSSLCPLRPLLTRVEIKELIHFLGLCYLGGNSPCTQQASSLLSDQQPWQKPRYRTYNFISISASVADEDNVVIQR